MTDRPRYVFSAPQPIAGHRSTAAGDDDASMECNSGRIHAWVQVCGLKLEECLRSCRDRLRAPAQSEVRAAILAINGYEEGARGDAQPRSGTSFAGRACPYRSIAGRLAKQKNALVFATLKH